MLAVWGPIKISKITLRTKCFLMVSLHLCRQSAVNPRLKIFYIQHRFCVLALEIGHIFTIWRRRRNDSTPCTTDITRRFSRLKVVTHNIKQLGGRIFAILPNSTRGHIIGVVEVLAIWRKRRISHIFLGVRSISSLGDHHPVTPRAVIHPDLTCGDRARRHKSFGHCNIVTIRAPGGCVDKGCFLFANLMRVTAIGIHYP